MHFYQDIDKNLLCKKIKINMS